MRDTVLLIVIIAYFVFMIGLGLWFARKVRSSDDYMVAGRSLSRLVLSATLLATWCGSGTIVGSANFSYTHGPLASIIYSAGAPVGILVMYFLLAKKIRGFGKYTVPQIMQVRYGTAVRVLTGVAILLAYIGIAAEQFLTLGYILNLTTGLPTGIGTMIGGVVMILSAVAGGLFSVAYADAISALIITVGLVGGFVAVLVEVGGFHRLVTDLPASHMSWLGGLSPIQMIGYFLPTLFLFLGDQNMYQRISAAKDARTAKQAVPGLFVGVLLFSFLVTVMASASTVLLPHINPDTAVIGLASSTLPTVFGAMILVAAVGLAVTTGNSFLLSAAGNVVYDIYGVLARKQLSQRHQIAFSRILLVILGILTYVLGEYFPSVLSVQLYSYTIYGAAITPSLLAIFLWRRATPAGSIASIVTGTAATLIWEIGLGRPFEWNSVLVALPLSIIALVVVSMLTRPRELSSEELLTATR